MHEYFTRFLPGLLVVLLIMAFWSQGTAQTGGTLVPAPLVDDPKQISALSPTDPEDDGMTYPDDASIALTDEDSDASDAVPANRSVALKVDPLTDLGMQSGEQFCVKVKSYTSTEISDFSVPACSVVSDQESLELTLNDAAESAAADIVGFYVYYSKGVDSPYTFLEDISV